MVDLLFLSAILIALNSFLFGVRFAYLRNHLSALRARAAKTTDEIYIEFEIMVYARKKANRDPQRLLNISSEYFGLKAIINDLDRYYRRNRTSEKIDILAVGFWLLIILIKYINDFYPEDRIFGLFIVILLIASYLSSSSIWSFLKLYFRINRYEDKLGIGHTESNR